MLIRLWLTLLGAALASAQAPPERYRLAWQHATPRGTPQAIACDRNHLYVALKEGGLAVLTRAPRAPRRELARLAPQAFGGLEVMHLERQGQLLYLALGNFFRQGSHAGLAVVDISRPGAPRRLALWRSPDPMRGSAMVVVRGRHAFLAAMEHGVLAFDVGARGTIEPLGRLLPDVHKPRRDPNRIQHPNARGLAIKGDRLFVAFDAGGLRVLDVSDPKAMKEIGYHLLPAMAHKQQAYNNIALDGDRAYAAIDYAGLEVIDIRDPRRPRSLGWCNPWGAEKLSNLWLNSPGHTNQIALLQPRRRLLLSAGDSELIEIDVSDPRKPRQVGRHGQPRNGAGVWGVTVADGVAYASYIRTLIPFRGTWAGVRALVRE